MSIVSYQTLYVTVALLSSCAGKTGVSSVKQVAETRHLQPKDDSEKSAAQVANDIRIVPAQYDQKRGITAIGRLTLKAKRNTISFGIGELPREVSVCIPFAIETLLPGEIIHGRIEVVAYAVGDDQDSVRVPVIPSQEHFFGSFDPQSIKVPFILTFPEPGLYEVVARAEGRTLRETRDSKGVERRSIGPQWSETVSGGKIRVKKNGAEGRPPRSLGRDYWVPAFNSGVSGIRGEHLPSLNKILQAAKLLKDDEELVLYGFADVMQFSDFRKTNCQLSQERADAVIGWLVSNGADGSKLRGEGLCETGTRRNLEISRRVEAHLVSAPKCGETP